MIKLICSLLFLFYSLSTLHCQQIPSNIDNLSPDHLDSLIGVCYDQSQYQIGLDLCDKAKQKILKEKGTTLDSLYSDYSTYSGIFLEELGQYDKAKEQHLAAVNILEKLFGSENIYYADAIRNLGRVAMFQSKYDEAFELYKKATSIFAKNGQSKIDYAFMENDLANLYRRVGNYKNAIQSYENARNAILEELGKDNDYYVTLSNNLAVIYSELGDLNPVEEIYLEALEITAQQTGKNSAGYGLILGNLGALYTQTGQKTKAKEIFQQALSIKEKIYGNTSHEYAYLLSKIATNYIDIGEYKICLQLGQQACSIMKKTFGDKSIQYLTTLVDLANLYGTTRENEKAIISYKKALVTIADNKDYQKLAIYITVLTNLGQVLINQKKEKEGMYYLEKAINTQQKSDTKYPIEHTLALSALAKVKKNTKDLLAAKKIYLEVLEKYEKIYGENHLRYILTLNNLAEVALLSRDTFNSYQWLQKAFLINTKVHLQLSSNKWVQNLKQITPIDKSQLLKSFELLRRLLIIKKRKKLIPKVNELGLYWTIQYANGLQGEGDKIRFLRLANDWVANSISELSLQKDKTKVFELIEQNKSILLRQAMASNKAEAFGNLPDSLVIQQKQLKQQKSKLEALLLQQDADLQQQYFQAELNAVNLTYDKFQEMIAREYPDYHSLSKKATNVSIQNLQKTIQPGRALIEYLVSDEVVFIICLTQNTIEIKQVPMEITLLRQKIKNFHHALSDYTYIINNESANYQTYTTLAHWFYTKLLAPVLTNKELTQLIIVPDAELGNLPFESFLMEDSLSDKSYADLPYLLKQYAVSYDYSASTWHGNEQKEIHTNKGLVGFAPIYTATTPTEKTTINRGTVLDNWRKGLTPLPDAKKEVLQLQRTFSGQFFFDEEATEANFKKVAPDAGIIHLAMHGILNFEHPILSSLVFSENQDTLENNFLQAYEISKMNLSSNLIVLSACETGYGKFERGNGIASLARSFMYAGTPSLVVSLWQVNDVATANIMTYFYENLNNGLSKPLALQAAKIKYLKNSTGIAKHPAFWSPFIQVGNTNAITIKSNNWLSYLSWVLLGGISFLLLIFGYKKYTNNQNIHN